MGKAKPSRPTGQIILFLAFAAIWLLAVFLHLRGFLGAGFFHPAVYVRQSDTDKSDPVFNGFLASDDRTDFRTGDVFRKLITEGSDGHRRSDRLADYGPYRFFALVQARIPLARRDELGQPVMWVQIDRSQNEVRERLPLIKERIPWRMLPVTIAVFLIGSLVLYKKPRQPFGVAFFVASACFSIHWTWFFGPSRTGTYLWMAVYPIVSALMYPFALRTAVTFPRRPGEDRFPAWFWLFAANGAVALTASVGAPLPPVLGVRAILIFNIAIITALIWLMMHRYRSSDEHGRRQLRWCLLGLLVGLTPMMALNLLVMAIGEQFWWLIGIGAAFEVLIPVCIGIGILNEHLYDIDRVPWTPILQANCALIGASVGLASLPQIEKLLRLLPAVAAFDLLAKVSFVTVLTAVGLFLPRWLRRPRELEDVVSRILRIADATLAPTVVAGMLVRHFEPASCIVYREAQGTLSLIQSSGDPAETTALPILPREGTLPRLMRNAVDAVSLELLRPMPPELHLLARYRPEVMVPFGSGAILLGQRGSGAHYSQADLKFLSIVAVLTRSQLERLGVAAHGDEKRVFVSHSSGDRAVANAIVRSLKTRGIASWYSPDDLETMDQWSERIRVEVRKAAVVVAVLSQHANASRWVAVEIETAREHGIPICPFVASALPPETELGSHTMYALEFQSAGALPAQPRSILAKVVGDRRSKRARIDALTFEVVRALAEGRAG